MQILATLIGTVPAPGSSTMFELPGAGTVPINVAKICMWTWVCSEAHDNHANEAGYGVIAGAFAIELGL